MKKTDSGIKRSIPWDAVIFDLDGVVTDTASVHARAWKEMFDAYLDKRRRENHQQGGLDLEPFDMPNDYLRYVDGKPRYDGVADFLKSRNISMPYGNPSDPSDKETVCGLGNRKNRLFKSYLRKEGVKTYDPMVGLIRRLKSAGIKTAVVSSSKNCAEVLDAAGISDIFDTRVDGKTSARLDLNGKPEPDIFLKAAENLMVDPPRAVVVEDAAAGVKAGHNGGFGCVVGINRQNDGERLKQNGADRVVNGGDGLESLIVGEPQSTNNLPSALLTDARTLYPGDRLPVIFLDFDGTLSPIVDHPDQATLPEDTAMTLNRLKALCRVAVISGRDLSDVRRRVDVDGIYYAGSHGFEIIDPEQRKIRTDVGTEALPALDTAENELRQKLQTISGVEVERKRFSIAVHFRRASENDIQSVEEIVDQIRSRHKSLRKAHGKKIFELQPDVNWHKGKAVRRLLKIMEPNGRPRIPIYIGDDVTDEDAFRTLRLDGIGIVVHHGRPKQTFAAYILTDPEQVNQFLKKIIDTLEENQR
jgi:alpha,alpha-trehalase